MTPKELRQRAWSHIESASSLFNLGKYDEASYLVGYSAEFALKARYCTRKGWADFPDDRAEAKRRGAGEIMIHDLERLLELTQHVRISTSSMLNIDWERARDWSEQQRYRPVGSVTPDQVKAQIEETRKLCEELSLYEIFEKLRILEREFSCSYGHFNFFGLVNLTEYNHFIYAVSPPPEHLRFKALMEMVEQNERWEVLMSAWWLLDGEKGKVAEFENKIQALLEDDLCGLLRPVTPRHPNDPLIRTFNAFACVFGGFIEHHPGQITMNNMVNGIILPPAFVITNIAYQEPTGTLTPLGK